MPQSLSVEGEYTWFACCCMTACLGLMFLAHVHPHHLPEFCRQCSQNTSLRTCWSVFSLFIQTSWCSAVSCPALWGGRRRLLVKAMCCDHACTCWQKSHSANLNTKAPLYAVRTRRADVGFVKCWQWIHLQNVFQRWYILRTPFIC